MCLILIIGSILIYNISSGNRIIRFFITNRLTSSLIRNFRNSVSNDFLFKKKGSLFSYTNALKNYSWLFYIEQHP